MTLKLVEAFYWGRIGLDTAMDHTKHTRYNDATICELFAVAKKPFMLFIEMSFAD